MRVKSPNSTSSKLIAFGKECAAYYCNLRQREPKASVFPNVNQFAPQYRRFAQAVLDAETEKHQQWLKQGTQ